MSTQIIDLLNPFGIQVKSSGYHRLRNPMDNSRHTNMVINFDRNFVEDHKTGYRNSVAGFLVDANLMSFQEAIMVTGDFSSPLIKNENIFKEVDTESTVRLPAMHSLFDDTIMAERCRNYWTSRGFDIHSLDAKGWGWSDETRWFGRTIIPFKVKGMLVYYIGRTFMGADPKYLNPESVDVSVGKTQLFYNQDALYRYNEGFLVEGVTDAEKVGPNCIASLGWKLSEIQIGLIIKSRWKVLNIIPDVGFLNKAISTALYFQPYMEVRVHKLPDGIKDIGEISINDLDLANPYKIFVK
jgi:hypothetical protein